MSSKKQFVKSTSKTCSGDLTTSNCSEDSVSICQVNRRSGKRSLRRRSKSATPQVSMRAKKKDSTKLALKTTLTSTSSGFVHLCDLPATCRYLKQKTDSPLLWRHYIRQFFGIPPNARQIYVDPDGVHHWRTILLEKAIAKALKEYLPSRDSDSELYIEHPDLFFEGEIKRFIGSIREKLWAVVHSERLYSEDDTKEESNHLSRKRSKSMIFEAPPLDNSPRQLESGNKQTDVSKSKKTQGNKSTGDADSTVTFPLAPSSQCKKKQVDWKATFIKYHSFLRPQIEPAVLRESATTSAQEDLDRSEASDQEAPSPSTEITTELTLVAKLQGHTDVCWTVISLGKDTNLIATASEDRTIRIWDIEEKKCITTLTWHQAAVYCVVVLDSIKGNIIASGSADGKICIWDWTKLNDNALIAALDAHDSEVEALAVISKEPTASGTEQMKHKKSVHEGDSNFIMKSKILVSGSRDDRIKIWDVERKKCINTIVAESGGINCLAVVNSHRIASAGMDALIKIWNLSSNYSKATLVQCMVGHTNLVVGLSTISIPFTTCEPSRRNTSRDSGMWVVSASYDGTIRCWDTERGFCMRTLSDHDGSKVNAFKVAPGVYPVIVSSSKNQKTRIVKSWNPRTSMPLRTLVGFVDEGEIHSFEILRMHLITTNDESNDVHIYTLKTTK